MNKREKYEALLTELSPLIEGESNTIGVLANVAALIKEKLGFFWVGFYLVKSNLQGEEHLALGPFQGPIACYRIGYGKGVCGTCWKERKTVVVEDVEEFPGHIACSSLSRSEIVVPLFNNSDKRVFGVLDIDSTEIGTFDSIDSQYLERAMQIVSVSLKL